MKTFVVLFVIQWAIAISAYVYASFLLKATMEKHGYRLVKTKKRVSDVFKFIGFTGSFPVNYVLITAAIVICRVDETTFIEFCEDARSKGRYERID